MSPNIIATVVYAIISSDFESNWEINFCLLFIYVDLSLPIATMS